MSIGNRNAVCNVCTCPQLDLGQCTMAGVQDIAWIPEYPARVHRDHSIEVLEIPLVNSKINRALIIPPVEPIG